MQQSKKKKIIIFAVIVLLFAGFTWTTVTFITRMQFEVSVDVFVKKALERPNLYIWHDYQSTHTSVNMDDNDLRRFCDLIKTAKRQKLSSLPNTDGLESITVAIDEKNLIVLYKLNSDGDTLILTRFEKNVRIFLVKSNKDRIFTRALTYIDSNGTSNSSVQ